MIWCIIVLWLTFQHKSPVTPLSDGSLFSSRGRFHALWGYGRTLTQYQITQATKNIGQMVGYGLFTLQHDCLTTFGPNKQTFVQANNDKIVTAGWLMGLFCKTDLASAWEVPDDWFMTSNSHAINHDWSTTTWHVHNGCRPNWARLCHFTPFIMIAVESCCRVNSTF